MTLSDRQRYALRVGSPTTWLGARERGVEGSTMEALERRGLAVVERARRPYPRHVYRLTEAGERERVRLMVRELDDDVLIEANVRGWLSSHELAAELKRRAGFELVVYYWPRGERGSYWARPGRELERRGAAELAPAGDGVSILAPRGMRDY